MLFVLESLGFASGQEIPPRHARLGENLSPPLTWRGAPARTKSFLLVVEDLDAPNGAFRHWGVYHIPADRDGLPEGSAAGLPQGINDFGNRHYDGPPSPSGQGLHHYRFRLCALDVARLAVVGTPRVAELVARGREHELESCEIVGTYMPT